MKFSRSTATYQIIVDIPQKQFPVYFGCNVQINGKALSIIFSDRNAADGEHVLSPQYAAHLSVPLGMKRGTPFPKGQAIDKHN